MGNEEEWVDFVPICEAALSVTPHFTQDIHFHNSFLLSGFPLVGIPLPLFIGGKN